MLSGKLRLFYPSGCCLCEINICDACICRWLPASPHFEIIGPPTLDFERDPSIYDGRIPFQSDTKHVQHGGNLAYAYASAECLAPRQNIGAQQPVRSSLSKALQGGHSPKKSHPKWLASPIFVVGKAGVVRAAG